MADDGSMMGRRISSLTMELAENCTYTRVLNGRAEAVDDATAGMIIVILLFVLPSSLSFWPFVERMRNRGLVRKYTTGAKHLQNMDKDVDFRLHQLSTT